MKYKSLVIPLIKILVKLSCFNNANKIIFLSGLFSYSADELKSKALIVAKSSTCITSSFVSIALSNKVIKGLFNSFATLMSKSSSDII